MGSSGTKAARAATEPGRSWRSIIREERVRVGLTQAALATRTGLAPDTIRKYENGSRMPPRDALERILDVLQVPIATARAAILDRGFSYPDFRYPLDATPGYYFTLDELRAFVEEVPWPQFVTNEMGELLAANRAAQALWGVDLAAELGERSRAGANLFAIMAEPRFVERIANWEEVCRHFVSLLKAVPASQTMLDDPGALFGEVFAAFVTANPRVLATLFRIWESTPPRSDKVRWMYPIIWREAGFDEIRFRGIVNPASEPEGTGFNDWFPSDAASHAALEAVLARPKS